MAEDDIENIVAPDITIRLILVGDMNTGKTSLLLRFVESKFYPKYGSTIGIDFRTKVLMFGAYMVKVQIFDTAGQERFHTITQAYYRNADAALIIFDITQQSSFHNTNRWLTDMDAHAANAVKVIVGNKCDMEESRVVQKTHGVRFAEESGCSYQEASAMTGQNVEETFMMAVRAVLHKKGILQSLEGDDVPPPAKMRPKSTIMMKPPVLEGDEKKKDSGCCF